MGRVGKESDFKSHLVTEICSISTSSIACTHRHRCSPVDSHFIDWYRVLGVEENAGIDAIRKRYHKLALQLHPDKNKHPKADIAFKLVSEAYTCLSDSEKRRAFDLERWKNCCLECNTSPYTKCTTPRNSNASKSKPKAWNHRCYKVFQGLKDIRGRLKEEANVIENCLRANAVPRKESPVYNPSNNRFPRNSYDWNQRESPIFNPSDYLFQGYPHLRTRVCKIPENYLYLQTGNILNYERGSARYDSPIFEVGSEKVMFRSKSTCVRS